ncbi:hypothetical protein [Cardinium endosymbiont of Nabis limbatus]|uniref:hypothetical protein n=1 Tax=Cardinium endosymbiont of Nabis limbatus TaxID=3066217 RepID=UPI003AF33E9C
MRLSIHKWFGSKLVVFLMVILGPFHQTIAHEYKYERSFIGLRGAIGGVRLPQLKQYATAHGYKDVQTPFGHLDLEGALYVESRIWNHMGFRIELDPRYIYSSFAGVADQNKKQSIGLHCSGGHISCLLYFYPRGRFADNGSWHGHIGVSLSSERSKDIVTYAKTKNNDKFYTDSAGLILGIGFEFTSHLQLECRYRGGRHLFGSTDTPELKGISLGIGYVLLK